MRARPGVTKRALTFAVAVGISLATSTLASAAALSIAPSYPQRIGGRTPSSGINHDECVSPIEKWRFSFVVPPVTYTELQVFARKTSGDCVAASDRAPGGACRLVARFARSDVSAGPLDIPSAAMITAADLGLDVADLASVDRAAACYPDADRTPAPLALSMLLFDGGSALTDVEPASYATTYDLSAPGPPTDLLATSDATTVHLTFAAPTSSPIAAMHAFCFDLDAAGDAGEAPCAIPAGFVVHDRFVAPGFDGLSCATAIATATTIDLPGLVPGHQYVFTVGAVDDASNTGAFATPACLRIGSVTPVEGDAGPPPLPPVSACSCRTIGLRASPSAAAIACLLLVGGLTRKRRARSPH